ncbi:MAG: MBL fold metallo-hydrolase [Gammaproteobacteria bacterium]|nr:MBL fold metallo-hydrolase [Gammaproteobacteria bacterium]
MSAKTTDFNDGITAIDTDYVKPQLDASHLVIRDKRAAFVDTGTTHSVPALLDALDERNIPVDYVDYVFLTHIHLDHAGGAGALMRELPNAKLVVHPRGARHMAEPAKLEAGTRAVYGDEAFERLYGEIIPVAEERIEVVEDGDMRLLGGSPMTFLHTPGHALHHYTIHDADARSAFTGDTFGISYRAFDTENGAFIFPATTPTHFDPIQARDSIDRILSLDIDHCFLTHYSRVSDLERLGEDLQGDLVAFTEIAKRCADEPDRTEAIRRMMRAYLGARLDEHGFPDDPARRNEWLEMDIDLNAKGLAVWLDRQEK